MLSKSPPRPAGSAVVIEGVFGVQELETAAGEVLMVLGGPQPSASTSRRSPPYLCLARRRTRICLPELDRRVDQAYVRKRLGEVA